MLLTEINTGKVFSWSPVISQVTEVYLQSKSKNETIFLRSRFYLRDLAVSFYFFTLWPYLYLTHIVLGDYLAWIINRLLMCRFISRGVWQIIVVGYFGSGLHFRTMFLFWFLISLKFGIDWYITWCVLGKNILASPMT